MATALSDLDPRRPLADLLSDRGNWPSEESLRFIRALSEQVAILHRNGQGHRAIDASTVLVGTDGRPLLQGPPATRRFGGEASGPEFCPPELALSQSVEIPGVLSAAVEVLASRGIRVDPRRIDVYQIGVLFCRLLTGKPLQSYLYSPSSKAAVPAEMRSLLDRSLGYDDLQRFSDCETLIAAIDCCSSDLCKDQAHAPKPRDTKSLVADGTNAGAAPARECLDQVHDLPLTRFGSCRIVGRLGQGGMGDVYKAHDESLDRWVAIKVLPPQLARDADFVARFRAEASAIARLTHPNVVQVYSIGEEQGHHFFVMQFVEGESLAERLHRVGRLDVPQTLAIVEQCLAGLTAAHEAGLIHRDIKPGNVLLEASSGRALIADFGLAKRNDARSGMTATGVILGTVDYLSPEQARGLAVDARSDLYSIGVLLYELLSGRLPFQADSATAMIFQHAYEPPRPLADAAPHVSPNLARIVDRLLCKSADERYQTARELLVDVESVRDGRAIFRPPRQRASQILKAPDFGGELTLPIAAIELPGRWERLRDRALSVVRRHTPEFVRELQNTSQQVDAAVAEYARRRQKLVRLRDEAQAVLADLTEQLHEQRSAGNEAHARATHTTDPLETAAAEKQKAECDAQAATLERLCDEQRHELNEIELKLARADATLARLQSQRELLQARLKTAGAEKRVAGVRVAKHRERRWAPLATAALALVLLAAVWLKSRRVESPGIDGQNPINMPKLDLGTRVGVVPPGSNGFTGLHGTLSPTVLTTTLVSNGRTPNYEFFVGHSDGSVRRFVHFGVRNVEEIDTWGDHTKAITAIVCSPDLSRIAVASEDSTIGVWDLASKREIRRLALHANPRGALQFSADGSQLMTGGADGFLRTWDIQTETELTGAPTRDPTFDIQTLAWSRDGSRAAIGYRVEGGDSLELWDVVGQRQVKLFRPSPRSTEYVAFLDKDTRLLSLIGREICVWDCETGAKVDTFGLGSAVLVAPDGRRLLVSRTNGRLELLDVKTKAVIKAMSVPAAPPTALAVSPDGLRAVSAAKNDVFVWELPDPAPLFGQKRVFDAESSVYTVGFSPDGFYAISGDERYVRMWDIQRVSNNLVYYDIGRRVTSALFSSDATRVLYATGMPNSRQNFVGLRVYSLSGATRLMYGRRDERHFESEGSGVVGVAFLPGSRRIVTAASDGMVRVLDLLTEEPLLELPTNLTLKACAASSDVQELLLAADDNTARLWSLGEQRQLRILSGHTFHVNGVAVATGAPRGATASGDRTVRVWEPFQRRVSGGTSGAYGRSQRGCFVGRRPVRAVGQRRRNRAVLERRSSARAETL